MDNEFSHILATFSGALAGGIAYNALVDWMEKRGIDGYTWLQVVGGVGMTLVFAIALVGWQDVMRLTALFAATGLPMIAGALYRREKRLARLVKQLRTFETLERNE